MVDYSKDLFDDYGRPIIRLAGEETGLFDDYGRPIKAAGDAITATAVLIETGKGSGKVLTSDSDGLGSWQELPVGTGNIIGGTGNFAGYGSYTTINIGTTLSNTNYKVHITPTENPSYVGEIWISDKTVNSFRVNNTGSGVSAFEWAVEVF